ncbi:MAG: hypothetical protein KGZ69_17460 [Methylomonas sp.]|nr:hypothetical protein [Methylomonas sp.]
MNLIVTDTQWVRVATKVAFAPFFVAANFATGRFDKANEELGQSVLMAEALYDSYLGCFFVQLAVLPRGSPR